MKRKKFFNLDKISSINENVILFIVGIPILAITLVGILLSILLIIAIILTLKETKNTDSVSNYISAIVLACYNLYYCILFLPIYYFSKDPAIKNLDQVKNMQSYLAVFKPEEQVASGLTFVIGIIAMFLIFFGKASVFSSPFVSFFSFSTLILLFTSFLKLYNRIKCFKPISDLKLDTQLLTELEPYINKLNIGSSKKVLRAKKLFYDKETFEKIQLLALIIENNEGNIKKSISKIENNISTIEKKIQNVQETKVENVTEYNVLGKFIYKITHK